MMLDAQLLYHRLSRRRRAWARSSDQAGSMSGRVHSQYRLTRLRAFPGARNRKIQPRGPEPGGNVARFWPLAGRSIDDGLQMEAEEYRRLARQCLAQAQLVSDAQAKAKILDRAAIWLSICRACRTSHARRPATTANSAEEKIS